MSDGPHRIERILASVGADLWALTPEKFAVVSALLARRATGARLEREEIRAALGTAVGARPVRGYARGVAIVPVRGILAARMNMVLEASGGTSTEQLAADLRELAADESVSAIVLAFDSPGGSCAGLTEAAAAMRDVRGAKPLIGVASHEAASAAFVLFAQCDKVIASPSAQVGALGVYTMHQDISGAAEKAGVKTTLISAGKFKTEANPFEPLSEEARQQLQRRVNETYAQLVADVAAGRGIDAATVRATFGEGRLVSARDALASGMVDEVNSLNAVIGDLVSTQSARVTRAPLVAARRQELATDNWQQRVSLDLRLLDL